MTFFFSLLSLRNDTNKLNPFSAACRHNPTYTHLQLKVPFDKTVFQAEEKMPKNQRNNSGWSYNNPERSQGISRVTGAGKRATQNKNQTYAKPLPPALDAASKPTAQSSSATSLFESILQALSFGYYQSQTDTNAARALQAQDDVVIACLDRTTNLVWIADTNEGVRLLWQRGFFGKGNLSRSEPTWKQRKVGEIDAMRKGCKSSLSPSSQP